MVLHVIAAFCTGVHQTPTMGMMEKCRIEADRLMKIVCRTDRGGELNKYLQAKPRVELRASIICVWYLNGSVFFSPDGGLRGLGYTPFEFPHEIQPMLTAEEAKHETREYAKRLGIPLAQTQISYRETEAYLESIFRPTKEGIPYDTAWYLTIERESGLLTSYRTADVPELYGSALPKITKEQAIASALSALTRFKRYDQYLVSDAGIALQVPAFFPGPKDVTEELRSIARAKKAIPVYTVRISRGESWSEEKGAYTEFDFVYVDGRDGRSMAIAEMSKFLMGQVSPSVKSAMKVNGEPIGIPSARGMEWFTNLKETPAPKVGEEQLVEITIFGKKWAAKANYSRPLGLLRIGTGEKAKWMRMTRPMISAVEWILSNPPGKFGVST